MKKISEIAGHIRQGKDVCFIIGAGASRSAGIPTAKELVEEINSEYYHCLKRLPEEDRANYGKVMSQLAPNEREQLISPLLEKAGINWGQIALASMAQEKFITRILTFNFDLVLERAAALLGLQLPVYDFGVAPTADISRIAQSAILHLHGQSYGLVLLNTEEETLLHKELLHPLISDTVRNHTTIVIGYSGETDGALAIIEEEYNSRNRLIWIGHRENPPPHLKSLLDKKYAEYIGGCDFDLTMIAIAKELGIWPPAIINNPMHHLLDELSFVKNYPNQNEKEIDVLSATRKRLEKYSKRWVEDSGNDEKAFALLYKDSPQTADISSLMEQSDNLSDDAKDALSWAFINDGNALSDEAKILSGSRAQSKFDEACEKYAQALEIEPDKHEALNNWGLTLGEEAQTLSGDKAQSKFNEAYQKYAQALEIKPDKHEALNNWGLTLSEEAKALSGDKAHSKFSEAYEKYAQTLEIKPNYHGALNNWGLTLSEEAKALSGDKAQSKFNEAYEKYALALIIKPDEHETLYNWGVALYEEAQTLSGDKAQSKFNEIYEKYALALIIKPDDHNALSNWGAVLSHEAKTLPGDKAQSKFNEAYEKYALALIIKPDEHETLYNWGIALSEEAQTLSGDKAQSKFDEACEKYAQAIEIKPDYHDAFQNWVITLIDEAKALSGDKAQSKFNEAKQKILDAKSMTGKASYDLACILCLTGRLSEAMDELLACHDDATLPVFSHLEADRDLDALRDKDEFLDLLKSVKQQDEYHITSGTD